MISNKLLYSFYFIYCYNCMSVAMADNFSAFEEEIQANPSSIENPSNEMTILSTVKKKTLNHSKKTLFNNISDKQNLTMKSKIDPYLKLNKDGIKVYVYHSKNSNFATFKATTYIDASLDSIIAVLLDTKATTQWIDSCDKALLIKKLSFHEQYHYQTFSIPFPFQNRDFILHSTMLHKPLSKVITITTRAVPDYCDQQESAICSQMNQSGLVRVKKSVGTFRLEADKNGTHITWIQFTDPAGHLPSWIVNLLVKNTPYNSFKNLAKKVREDKYKFAKLIYDIDGVAINMRLPESSSEDTNRIATDYGVYPTF